MSQSSTLESEIRFAETQRIRQWWVWLILLSMNVLSITALIVQLGFDIPFGDKPASNPVLISISIFLLAFTGLMASIKLETVVTNDAVKVRMFPFDSRMREYPIRDIASIEVRKYSPLAEFGGWGLRFSMKGNGRALTISGNRGIQIQFKNGEKLLIGTCKAGDVTLPMLQRESTLA